MLAWTQSAKVAWHFIAPFADSGLLANRERGQADAERHL